MPVSPHTPSTQISLLSLLKEHFGFTAFRPLQEAIIRDVLAGRDVLALLPTGGGKSLCFQLPALARPGVTIVVSPLIALMKDQVDGLRANGIAATFLNSSLTVEESQTRLRGLRAGHYRLLYMAPERLMLPGYLSLLKNFQVNLLAIDEAHCISEWGHDFRPEYRKLNQLKQLFPQVPLLALTATATERVREDILQQLQLQNAERFVASFNRPNLNYNVAPKDKAYKQILDFVRARKLESGIVYCHSRNSAERLAERLNVDGVRAKAYHAGLSNKERARNQDLFLRDEIQVICATIAFGMGINKSNVRFVIHHDLPKNLEAYYQETGRAGRDGLASDCLLLYRESDVVKIIRFIEEKEDFKEQALARAQLKQMTDYAESLVCRRQTLLQYFGENFVGDHCGACDNCLKPQEKVDATGLAQKFLSCVYRIREKSGFAVGMTHVILVLTGSQDEKVLKLRHQNLSTYGIGQELSRKEWRHVGQQLLRLGLVEQSKDGFSVLSLSREGLEALKTRQKIMLHLLPKKAEEKYDEKSSASSGGDFDETLFAQLKILRKKLADERNVPAYIIFSDASLRQMARDCPTRREDFARISGVGEKKLKEFGEVFQNEILEYTKTAVISF